MLGSLQDPQVGIGDSRLPPRFWSKVRPDASTGCWLWTGPLFKHGYGRLCCNKARGRRRGTEFAHRIAYEALIGPVPPGLELDHFRCDRRSCVNPAHLRPVTHRENVLRGRTFTSANAAKTHCPRGHEFTTNNLVKGFPRRWCRICRNECQRRWRRNRGAAGSAA